MRPTYPGGIEDPERFRELLRRFDRDEQRDYYYERALETVQQEFEGEWYESDELILGGPMLLLYTWNFAAQKTKVLDKNHIQELFERHHELFEDLRDVDLVKADLRTGGSIDRTLQAVWGDMCERFDQTGTAKVLSLLAPRLFVIWDQDIRTRRQRSRSDPPGEKRPDRGVYFFIKENGRYSLENNSMDFGKSAEDYLVFLRYCRDVLEDIGDHPVFEEKEDTPAKLLDEALYAFYKLENG